MVRLDLEDPKVLAKEIANGRVWSGPGWAIELAAATINSGKVPMPEYIPDEYRPLITRDDPPQGRHVEPMAGGGGYMPSVPGEVEEIDGPMPEGEGPAPDPNYTPLPETPIPGATPLGGEALA